ncbi:MAG: hypothetical protein H6739_34630 [Alphaproteobacteria bacterium]|nr:hypothetical protein [Alphaproteobacteria bacterium]
MRLALSVDEVVEVLAPLFEGVLRMGKEIDLVELSTFLHAVLERSGRALVTQGVATIDDDGVLHLADGVERLGPEEGAAWMMAMMRARMPGAKAAVGEA